MLKHTRAQFHTPLKIKHSKLNIGIIVFANWLISSSSHHPFKHFLNFSYLDNFYIKILGINAFVVLR